MALVDDVAAFAAERFQRAPESRAATGAGGSLRRFADAPRAAPFRAPTPRTTGGYILIQDINNPGTFTTFPRGLPVPPGWAALGNISLAEARLRFGEEAAVGRGFGPRLAPDSALIRLSARAVNDADRARRQREIEAARKAQKEAQRVRGLLAIQPRPPRPPRLSRPWRPRRIPRPPREPRPARVPRIPGTKVPRQKELPNVCAAVTGPCVIARSECGKKSICWPFTPSIKQIEAWSIANCGRVPVVTKTGSGWLTPLLALLPRRFETTPAVPPERRSRFATARFRKAIPFSTPLPLGAGAPIPPPVTAPSGTRTLVGGCSCTDWPGWVICPYCISATKCTCQGRCIAFPASTGNCATP